MLQPGVVLDRYEVIDELGRGGMAVVYRVRHNTLGSVHALKILTLHGESIRDRLVQEGRVQAGLRHPNIVAVTDVIDVSGSPGLVMEYIDGPSLEAWLLDHKPDLATAEQLFRGVLAGVRRAHRDGLVHRDLKPGNVLLESTEEGLIPKVADFGLAKALEAGGGMNRTRTGIAMGTPAYMAPEQIRDAKNVDGRADIFTLGCILYALVVGQAPFEGPDVLSIFNSVCEGRYVSARERVAVSPHLDDAIQGCLQVDRDRRIPTCDALLEVLDGAAWASAYDGATAPPPPTLDPGAAAGAAGLSGSPATGGPTTGAPRSRPSRETMNPMAPHGTSSQVSLLPDIEPASSLVPRAAPAEIAEPESPPRRRGPLVAGLLGLAGLGLAAVVLLGGGDDPPEPAPAEVEVLKAPPDYRPAAAEPEPEPAPAPTTRRRSSSSRKTPKTATAPAPAPEPAPAAAAAEPDPDPDPAPMAPEPATEETRPRLVDKLKLNLSGTYRVRGDAQAVWLVGETGTKHSAGDDLPNGRYEVKARFKSWDGVVDAGTVNIPPGTTITITCQEALLSCSK